MTQMHALNMTVHASDSPTLEGWSDVQLTKMMVLKGIDGVYTDYPMAKLRAS